MCSIVSASDIPYVPASILKRKSNISRAIDSTSRHKLETKYIEDGNTTLSITKRKSGDELASVKKHFINQLNEATNRQLANAPEKPSTKALAIASNKLSTNNVYHPARQENVSDIANVSKNQAVSTVSKNAIGTATKSQKKTSDKKKNWFSDDGPIYDAKYTEMDDELVGSPKYNISKASRKPSQPIRKAPKDANEDIVWITVVEEIPSKRGFKTVPSRNARNLGLAKKSKSLKPASIASISKSKEKTKQSLMKRPSKQVTVAEGFDYLVDQFRGKPTNEDQTTQKKKHSLKSNIVRGIKDVNEVCEEIGKNPNLQRIKVQQEADLRHMASAGRRVRGSIIAGNNRRQLSDGSLVKQHTFGTRTNTTTMAPYISQPKVIPKVIHRKGGDIVRYFTDSGLEISAPKARKILNDSPLPKIAYQYPDVSNITEATDQPIQTAKNIVNTTALTGSALVTRNHNTIGVNKVKYDPIGRITKTATPSALVNRHHPGVV